MRFIIFILIAMIILIGFFVIQGITLDDQCKAKCPSATAVQRVASGNLFDQKDTCICYYEPDRAEVRRLK